MSAAATQGGHNKRQDETRWLYCVECPQYSTRRRSACNIHCSGMLCEDR